MEYVIAKGSTVHVAGFPVKVMNDVTVQTRTELSNYPARLQKKRVTAVRVPAKPRVNLS